MPHFAALCALSCVLAAAITGSASNGPLRVEKRSPLRAAPAGAASSHGALHSTETTQADSQNGTCPVGASFTEPGSHAKFTGPARRRVCGMRQLFKLGAEKLIKRHWQVDFADQEGKPLWTLTADTTVVSGAAFAGSVGVLREHVREMYAAREQNTVPHLWDPVFSALASVDVQHVRSERELDEALLFRSASEGQTVAAITDIPNGLRVVEKTRDACVAELLRLHAKVVDLYISNGPREAAQSHALPDICFSGAHSIGNRSRRREGSLAARRNSNLEFEAPKFAGEPTEEQVVGALSLKHFLVGLLCMALVVGFVTLFMRQLRRSNAGWGGVGRVAHIRMV